MDIEKIIRDYMAHIQLMEVRFAYDNERKYILEMNGWSK
ncbi:MAG: hypothetical protein JWO47_402 [Candidatus Saccharibacteria bacterium]|nr:hypothetical protein [Candidatus Saccharibacteria bacterium]